MSDIFNSLSFSEEDVQAVLDEFEAEQALNGQICACGHPVKHHKYSKILGITQCTAGKQLCNCAYVNPVLRVSNSRFFMRKSTGHGPRHALTLGIHSVMRENLGRSEDNQISMDWMNNPVSCEKCKATDKKLSPILLTTNRTRFDLEIETKDRLVTALLCGECAG